MFFHSRIVTKSTIFLLFYAKITERERDKLHFTFCYRAAILEMLIFYLRNSSQLIFFSFFFSLFSLVQNVNTDTQRNSRLCKNCINFILTFCVTVFHILPYSSDTLPTGLRFSSSFFFFLSFLRKNYLTNAMISRTWYILRIMHRELWKLIEIKSRWISKEFTFFSRNERKLKTAENCRNFQANLIFNQVHIHLHYILDFSKYLAQFSNVSICQTFQII